MTTLTAVLFAGGESRRMGADKAELVWDGKPFWSRQLRTLGELNLQKIFISARTRPSWCPSQVEAVLDEPPSRGPLSGLVAALERIQTSHLLALAIDLPQMTPAHLKKLWSLAQPGVGVIPQNGKFFEPLCAVYSVETIGIAAKERAGSNVSLQSLARILAKRNDVRIYPLNKGEQTLYANVNTPADLK
ncbi:MAG: molybdenum cofactor guanylyltransferase [Limisphaerales bacterium]